MMRALLYLKPGQKGTKQLLAQYGNRLVCVRYRYDVQWKKRFKTVELIVAEHEREPPAPRFTDDAIVGVRVGFAEVEVRDQVKQAGESGIGVARCGSCATRRSSHSSWNAVL
jgi:hypothetical protein